MHFAIERLFYEENREKYLVPGKSSRYRKIRNMEVRYIEVRLYFPQPPYLESLDHFDYAGFSVLRLKLKVVSYSPDSVLHQKFSLRFSSRMSSVSLC
ncbi:hypothetical protein TNCV_2493601 [Trichonephila clavipes]|uniref:Uncharacterized protein n=1 Tax=Trichonephila clavipes TaxID=2585209 RepID=A0A8X6VAN2_TRICX|nr:hypothetical protein TNCV_2493601 [Trichonephila clavipes]